MNRHHLREANNQLPIRASNTLTYCRGLECTNVDYLERDIRYLITDSNEYNTCDEFLVRTKPSIRSSRRRGVQATHPSKRPKVEWEHHAVIPFPTTRKSEVCVQMISFIKNPVREITPVIQVRLKEAP